MCGENERSVNRDISHKNEVIMNTNEDVVNLWTKDSDSFDDMITKQFNSETKNIWRKLLLQSISNDKNHAKILDAGTGTGFFAIILSSEGYDVTGVDFTDTMLEKARLNANNYGVSPDFIKADLSDTDFSADFFDVIVSRNVVWTMPEPEKTFREWKRICKPGGKVIIFDANWNIRLFDEKKQREYEVDIEEAYKRFPEQGEIRKEFPADELNFRLGLPMCRVYRPQWDFDMLYKLGFSNISVETDISKLVLDERSRIQFRSTPMFKITAIK